MIDKTYQFWSNGREVDFMGDDMNQASIVAHAVVLAIAHCADITVTKNGTFYDRAKKPEIWRSMRANYASN